VTAAFDVVDGARSRHRSAIEWFVENESHQGAVHMQITTIDLDIAKNVFQVRRALSNERPYREHRAYADASSNR
jgi:hypothetical protein